MSTPTTLPVWHESALQEQKKGQSRQRIRQLIVVSVLGVLIYIACVVCNVDIRVLATGLGKGLELLKLFVPPEWSSFPRMIQPILVTIVMALAATILGAFLSIPCAFAASSNIAPRWLRLSARFFIGVERGIPEIILLLFMVAVFGLGAFPGFVALSISSIGMLAKLLADAIEEVDPHVAESVVVTGCTHSQVIRYAIVPQILPSLCANALFRFEVNVRASVLLGAVGAGGIGYEISTAMSSLEYPKATVAILSCLGLVILSERSADFLRRRVLSGGQLL